MGERRLQTKGFKQGLAKSIHHARVLIRQRHIRVGRQICDIPSFMVRTDSEKHIDFALTSPFSASGRPGRVARACREWWWQGRRRRRGLSPTLREPCSKKFRCTECHFLLLGGSF